MVMSFKMLQLPFIFTGVSLSLFLSLSAEPVFPLFRSKQFNSPRIGDKSRASLLYFTYLEIFAKHGRQEITLNDSVGTYDICIMRVIIRRNVNTYTMICSANFCSDFCFKIEFNGSTVFVIEWGHGICDFKKLQLEKITFARHIKL